MAVALHGSFFFDLSKTLNTSRDDLEQLFPAVR
jgi:hypothetical protein